MTMTRGERIYCWIIAGVLLVSFGVIIVAGVLTLAGLL